MRPRGWASKEPREGMVVRRLLLEKTRNHVYYEVHENEAVVMIVALWGAVPRRRAAVTRTGRR